MAALPLPLPGFVLASPPGQLRTRLLGRPLSSSVTLVLPDIHQSPRRSNVAKPGALPAHFDGDGDGKIDAAELGHILSANKGKILQHQINGIRRVKKHVGRKREDKDDRRRMVDLDVAYSFQMEKMEQYTTSVLSQKRSLMGGGSMGLKEERALATMQTEAMEAALNVSKKVSAVHRLGREQIQSSRGYDRGRDRGGQFSDRSEKGQGWGKMEKVRLSIFHEFPMRCFSIFFSHFLLHCFHCCFNCFSVAFPLNFR